MADCGGNPLSWGGCVENAGAAAWNWLTTVGSDIGNSWNGLPEWASVTIVITAVAAAIIVTAGAATPELLPGILFFLAGDAGALGGGAGFCEEDPQACTPPLPTGPDIFECPPIGGTNPGGGEGGELAQTVNRDFGVSFETHIAENHGEVRNIGPNQLTVSNEFGTYVPDFRSGAEAKAVQYLPQTSQMKIALLNAQETGVPFKSYILENTVLSRQMLLAYSSGLIDLVWVPFE